jgi:hypothetical protein
MGPLCRDGDFRSGIPDLASDRRLEVASEHGPVSFRTEYLIPWTIGNHPASSLDSNYL